MPAVSFVSKPFSSFEWVHRQNVGQSQKIIKNINHQFNGIFFTDIVTLLNVRLVLTQPYPNLSPLRGKEILI